MNSIWKLKIGPIKLPYILIELADDYSHCVVGTSFSSWMCTLSAYPYFSGYPSRAYLWLMSRQPHMPLPVYNTLLQKLSVDHGYDVSKVILQPQKWPGVCASDLSSALGILETESSSGKQAERQEAKEEESDTGSD